MKAESPAVIFQPELAVWGPPACSHCCILSMGASLLSQRCSKEVISCAKSTGRFLQSWVQEVHSQLSVLGTAYSCSRAQSPAGRGKKYAEKNFIEI